MSLKFNLLFYKRLKSQTTQIFERRFQNSPNIVFAVTICVSPKVKGVLSVPQVDPQTALHLLYCVSNTVSVLKFYAFVENHR
jgi:hypothetical protein